MTDVNVVIQENSIPVVIDSVAPEITITDASTQRVTVVQASPISVVAAGGDPVVIVSTGGGAMDTSLLLDRLISRLTRVHMSAALSSDLERLESLWIRIGNELLLTESDGLSIQELGRNYTDSSIQDIVADINISVDGKFDIAYSFIEQTANSIDQRVTSIQGETNDRLLIAESRILQTESSITSTVYRLDTIDGPGGDIELLMSAIQQNADSISLEVAARQIVEGNLQSTSNSLSLLTDSVALMSTTIDTLGDRTTAAELILGEDGINLSVLQEALGQQEYSISAVQTLLANQWGVVISEDAGGNRYSSGFGLLVHPIWILGEAYVEGATIFYQDIIYECLVDHTANVINAPTGTEGETYWEELSDGVKSEFTVDAGAFYVYNTGITEPVFTVVDGHVGINGGLIIDSITSLNYPNAGEAWFTLNPVTGEAAINNMTMTFTTDGRTAAQTALNVADGADVTDYNAIEAYADAQASLAEISAKAYADGIVTTEEARAIADAQAKADAAQAVAIAYTKGWCEKDATCNTGALADLDYVTNSHVTNVTSIFGGKVNTNKIQNAAGTCYFDLTSGDILLNDISTIKIGTTTNYAYLAGYQKSIWLMGKSVSDTDPALIGCFPYGLRFVSGGSSTTTFHHSGTTIRPDVSDEICLGNSSYLWESVWADSMYTSVSGYFDTLDDLAAIHSMKPKEKKGKLFTDILTMPKEITNYEKLYKEVLAENGSMITEEDFEELLQDDEELGYRLMKDISKANDLTTGAIRQLDNEVSDLLQQVADWVSNIETRLSMIEQEITA